MRHIENTWIFRRYLDTFGFLSFARNFGDKYGKKLADTAIKKGKDFATIAGKKNSS